MEFLVTPTGITLESEKKLIEFTQDTMILDGLLVDMAGEYEKGWFLLHVAEREGVRFFELRIEGYKVGYVGSVISEISSEMLDFLGDLDLLIVPGAKTLHPVIVKIEPRLLVAFGPQSSEIGVLLGNAEMPLQKYKLKDADLSSDKTNVVLLG